MQLIYREVKFLTIVNIEVMHFKAKNISIYQKSYKGLELYSASYDHEKLMKILYLYYLELVAIIEKPDEKKYLMFNNNIGIKKEYIGFKIYRDLKNW